MGEYDSLLKATYGSADFTLTDYSVQDDSVSDGLLQIQRKIVVTADGYIDGSDAADFAAKLDALRTAFQVPGQSLTITGLGGQTEYSLLAPACLDGGPYASFTQQPGQKGTAWQRWFQIKIEAVLGIKDSSDPNKNPGKISDTRKAKVQTRADGVRRIEYTGKMAGPDCSPYFEAAVMDQLRQQYPWPDWIISVERDGNPNDTRLDYTLRVEQTVDPLYGADDNNRAMDGTASIRVERDEQMRQIRTLSFDLLVIGDPEVIRSQVIRPNGQTILRESYEITLIREQRLRATFVILESGEGNDLLDWSQSVDWEGGGQTVRIVEYDGVKSIPVYDSKNTLFKVTISGRAVGLGRYPTPPDVTNLNGMLQLAKPTYRHEPVNQAERAVTWNYQLVGDKPLDAGQLAQFLVGLERPSQPKFLN